MKRLALDKYRGPFTLGVDVSKWNDEDGDFRTMDLDFEAMAADVDFVVVRTGDGKTEDPLAVHYAKAAHAAGLPVGFYHYERAVHGVDVNLGVIRGVIERAGVPVLFVAPDIEKNPHLAAKRGKPAVPADGAWWKKGDPLGVSTSQVVDVTIGLGEELEADGHRVLIYGNVSLHFYITQKGILLPARWPLWAPYYTSGPWPLLPCGPEGQAFPWAEYLIWQHTSKGRVAGAERPLDMNRFRGSPAEFRRYFGLDCDA